MISSLHKALNALNIDFNRSRVDTHAYSVYNSEGGPLAQLAEQLTLNQQVTGSIPVLLTKF